MLLALDTSTSRVSVAVGDPAASGDPVRAEGTASDARRHAESVMPLVAQAMQQAGLSLDQVTCVVIGVGPGPFTGLRVGLMTGQALAEVAGASVRGVCSLDVIAVEAAARGIDATDFLVATDARRREVYWARYDERGRRLAGPGVDKPAAVVTGGRPVAGTAPAHYPDQLAPALPVTWPAAGWIVRGVATGSLPTVQPDPWYLRMADARPVAPGATKNVLQPRGSGAGP